MTLSPCPVRARSRRGRLRLQCVIAALLEETLQGPDQLHNGSMADSTPTFRPGDIVRLKTGGQDMVVHSHDGELVTCIWFGLAGKACKVQFPGHELIHAGQTS